MKKRIIALITAAVISTSTVAMAATNIYDVYDDVSTHMGENFTLGEFCEYCVNYFDLYSVAPQENSFVDLNNNKYADNVLRLVALGCINGYGDGIVGVDDVISKSRAYVILTRLEDKVFNEETENAEAAQRYDNVTNDMFYADFWTAKNPDRDKVLLSADEIKALNDQIYKTDETYMKTLSELPQTFDGIKLRDSAAEFESYKGMYIDGKPVTEEYYQNLRDYIKSSAAEENMPLKYGITVNVGLLKAYPYDEIISDSADDPEFDEFANTSVSVNTPLVVYLTTADGKFSYVRAKECGGWVRTEDIAFCDREEWLKEQDYDKFIIVTGEKIYLENNIVTPQLSEKMLDMGTKLEIASANKNKMIDNRIPWNSYVVNIPTRDENGNLNKKKAMIPFNRDVNVGYLPLTENNVINLAFKMLGNRYGWGGMLNSYDCSQYLLHIYSCFGMDMPRNTTWQAAMPVEIVAMDNMTIEEKEKILDNTMPGTPLQFSGHTMMYLGSVDGRYYTISDTSSVADAEGNKLRVRSVIINDLSMKRLSGHSWLEDLNMTINVMGGLK